MKKVLKKKWIEALRSGDYEQGKFLLRSPEGAYCCLGVLCNVAGFKPRHRRCEDTNNYSIRYDDRDDILTDKLLIRVGLTMEQQDVLTALNDDGHSFTEIAEYIEKEIV